MCKGTMSRIVILLGLIAGNALPQSMPGPDLPNPMEELLVPETIPAQELPPSESVESEFIPGFQMQSPLAPQQTAMSPGTGLSDDERFYWNGKSALETRQWEEAISWFQRLIDKKASRADASLYWKAYAQNKLNHRVEARATLESLISGYPTSRWVDDAKSLDLQVRQASGQPVFADAEDDEDRKLLALNGMIHSDPEHAVPVIDKILQKNGSLRLKERALFVLAQSRSTKSRELVSKLARGGINPDLQYKAAEYLGYQSTADSRQTLASIYASSNDPQLKRAVLRGYVAGRDRERLITTAKAEMAIDLRREAIRGLGILGADTELWQLYQSEQVPESRVEIVRSLHPRNDSTTRLTEAAKAEPDPRVKKELILLMGYVRAPGASEALLSLYTAQKDPAIRAVVLQSLFRQNNAKALVDIARGENNNKLKQSAVEMLSHMKSKEATEFLVEVLNK